MHARYVILSIILFAFQLHAERTFFMPRQITTDPTFEQTLHFYEIYHVGRPADQRVYFFLSPLYIKSKNGSDIAKYFLPCDNKACISIKEDGTGDVGSLWLNLQGQPGSSYSSIVSLDPKRRVLGSYFQFLWLADALKPGVWFNLCTALIEADHDLHLNECGRSTPAEGPLKNAVEAFNQPSWKFQRLSPRSRSHVCIDDVQLKLGYNVFYLETHHLGVYAVGTIPTGNKPRARYLFEPLVGTRSGSIGFGMCGDAPIFYDTFFDVSLLVDLKYRYCFPSIQTRSFDLCPNGNWSRYLKLVCIDDPSRPAPGNNVLTSTLYIKPRTTFDLWTAVHIQRDSCHLEFGYDLWLRVRERAGDLCNLVDGFAIYDLPCQNTGNCTSASKARISQSIGGVNPVISDRQIIPLIAQNINIQSALHPRVLSHKFFAAVGIQTLPVQQISLNLGLAAAYEFAGTISTLEQASFWVDFGIAF